MAKPKTSPRTSSRCPRQLRSVLATLLLIGGARSVFAKRQRRWNAPGFLEGMSATYLPRAVTPAQTAVPCADAALDKVQVLKNITGTPPRGRLRRQLCHRGDLFVCQVLKNIQNHCRLNSEQCSGHMSMSFSEHYLFAVRNGIQALSTFPACAAEPTAATRQRRRRLKLSSLLHSAGPCLVWQASDAVGATLRTELAQVL